MKTFDGRLIQPSSALSVSSTEEDLIEGESLHNMMSIYRNIGIPIGMAPFSLHPVFSPPDKVTPQLNAKNERKSFWICNTESVQFSNLFILVGETVS